MTDACSSPDITLTIDVGGVIRSAVASAALGEESLEAWRGRAWRDTIETSANGAMVSVGEREEIAGGPRCFRVLQRLPSGRELPIEFTTVSLGSGAGFVAIGKNLQTMSDLQARLRAEQQAREQDHWKIREIETRYRLLFDISNEAVLLVRLTNLRIVEANAAATRTLGFTPGAEFSLDLQPRDRKSLEAMLDKVRETGRAPGIVLHLGAATWSLRVSLMNAETGSYYLFQIAPLGSSATAGDRRDSSQMVETIVQRLPDGFAIVDRQGLVQHANHTFLDLVQISAESAVVNQSMKRWLSRPGSDIQIVLSLAQRHGSVRRLLTTLSGELGSNTEVEISAVGNRDVNADCFGLLIRDVSLRARLEEAENKPHAVSDAFDELDAAPLERLVKRATETVERRAIKTALDRSAGNRTIAAKRLGLSRQSLHAKLNKYVIDESS